MKIRCIGVVLLLACSSLVLANSISMYRADVTKYYSLTKMGYPWGDIYLTVTAKANPIEITGFDFNKVSNYYTSAPIAVEAAGQRLFYNESMPLADSIYTANHFDMPAFRIEANTQTVLHFMSYSYGGYCFFPVIGMNGLARVSNSDLSITGSSYPGSGQPSLMQGGVYYNVIPEPTSLALCSLGLMRLLRRK